MQQRVTDSQKVLISTLLLLAVMVFYVIVPEVRNRAKRARVANFQAWLNEQEGYEDVFVVHKTGIMTSIPDAIVGTVDHSCDHDWLKRHWYPYSNDIAFEVKLEPPESDE